MVKDPLLFYAEASEFRVKKIPSIFLTAKVDLGILHSDQCGIFDPRQSNQYYGDTMYVTTVDPHSV